MKSTGKAVCAVFGLALVGVAISPRIAGAGRTREFRAYDLTTILEGKLEGVSVSEDGVLTPGPKFSRSFAGEVAYVWALVPDGSGGVYAATGSDGEVYHVKRDGTAELVADSFEYELFALAVSPSGELYFAGAPNGTIQRWRPGTTPETVVDLPEGSVWDLLVTPTGELFATSGEKGEIYRVDKAGKTETLGNVPDAHAVSMAWWRDRILCGTDGNGLLVSLRPADGAKEVLFDASQEEIVAILPHGDDVLFAANGAQNTQPASSGEGDVLTLPVIDVRPAGRSAGAVLYELRPDGLVHDVWRAPEKQILSLALAPDGRVLVGTGSDGVLYALDSLWNAVRLADLEEADILSLAVDGRRVFAGTGNAGAVYVLDWEGGREGTYTSRVLDAGLTSRWGTPRWISTGTGELTFETRSGQLRQGDETWSPWVLLAGGHVASPPARFLQWRMTMKAAAHGDLRVAGVGIPYRGPNRSPEIAGIEITPKSPVVTAGDGGHNSGAVRQELPGGIEIEYNLGGGGEESRPVESAGLWSRSLRSAVWSADDPDGDRLRYDLYLRFVGDEAFYLLKADLEETAWTWEAAAWPDGWYCLKVIARDSEDNSPEETLRGERVSAPFQIDNLPPQLLDLRVGKDAHGDPELSGRAVDEGSRIASLAFSLDGEKWRTMFPADGICDSGEETLRITLPMRQDGRRAAVVGVRAADEVGHIATARLWIPVQ